MNIVCFSTADWDTLLPTNKHQLMKRLARKHRVLFIETLGTRAPRLGSGTDLGRIGRRLARVFQGAVRREKRLWTLSPLVRPRWKTSLDRAANRALFGMHAGSSLRHFPQPIAWVYSPYAVHLLDALRPRLVVYHMVDDLAAVPGADSESLREAENRLLARADCVFCTERSLYERARAVTRAARFLPNVADYEHFSHPVEPTEADPRLASLRAMRKPLFLFSGNLAPHKVDLELLVRLARRTPEWSWAIVGPEWEGAEPSPAITRLRRLSNVRLLGHVPYERLPIFLHEADCLLIPYVRNEATRAVFPLKFFEYLSTGRPVVTSPLPSLEPYGDLVLRAETDDEWIAACRRALEDRHDFERQRRALARRHTWDVRLAEMESVLRDALDAQGLGTD